jgi:peptidoglycan/LPS O-acetylase OafA/YrhL
MKHRDHILDLVRGLSALMVMLGHLRGFIFLQFGDLRSAGFLTKGFYFATGLGHQAVMVFFVLSGYFVGGSILSALSKDRFIWRGYAAARFTRLWMVLVPALVLTFGIDLLGSYWTPGAYAGELHASFMSGPTSDQPAVHDIMTFLGNLCFVQTVSVPVYGSNGPLWSLANEFWYYVMFPLGAVALMGVLEAQRRWIPLLQFLLLGLLICWLPLSLVMGGLVWVMGAGVWWLLRESTKSEGEEGNQKSEREGLFARRALIWFCRGWAWRVIGGGIFFGALIVSKMESWIGSDYLVGITFALWMLSLPGSSRMAGWRSWVVTGLSEISYTLYVVHFPLLFFIAAVVLKGRKWPANGQGFLLFGGLIVVVLAISVGMWWLFERNTDRVRKRLWGDRLIMRGAN